MIKQNPNIAVWKVADDYCNAATLLDDSSFRQAQVLASLGIEILLKSFLATRIAPWTAKTKTGHSYEKLYKLISQEDKDDLISALKKLDPEINLEKALRENDGLFLNSRYLYELNAPKIVPGNTVYLGRTLSKAVSQIAKDRNC